MRFVLKYLLMILLPSLPLLGQGSAMQLVGSPRPVTPAGAGFMAPIWSPDSQRLAVTTANYKGVYLVDISGQTAPVQYGDETVSALGVQFSPAGERLLVYLVRQTNRRRHGAIGVIDLISGELTALTPFDTRPTGEATWLRSGQEVHLLKRDASQYLAVPGISLSKQADRAPDETLYYLDRSGQVARRTLSTGEVVAIKSVPGRKLNLKISPDSTKMVFEIVGGHLWVTTIDGSHPVDLGLGYRPAWAPDGTRLAFMATTDDGHQFTSTDIIVVRADGTGRVNITSTYDRLEMNPAWSPDGRFIAYDAMDTGRIYVQEVQ